MKRIINKVVELFGEFYYAAEYKFNWVGIYASPFKAPKVLIHAGPVRVGFPYFLPRRVNKDRKFVRKKIGFSACGLGYKTKWTENDYRHEWDPCYGFVFCGLQIAIKFHLHTAIWESWLIYENCTEGVPLNRLRKCRKLNPNVWTSNEGKTDYFLEGLKDKYRNAFTK